MAYLQLLLTPVTARESMPSVMGTLQYPPGNCGFQMCNVPTKNLHLGDGKPTHMDCTVRCVGFLSLRLLEKGENTCLHQSLSVQKQRNQVGTTSLTWSHLDTVITVWALS